MNRLSDIGLHIVAIRKAWWFGLVDTVVVIGLITRRPGQGYSSYCYSRMN